VSVFDVKTVFFKFLCVKQAELVDTTVMLLFL